MSKYSEHYPIPCFMFDVNSRLRPSSFMDIAQELAAKDSIRSGFSDADLHPYNLVWILSRMSVRFLKSPVRGDAVEAQTWHKGADGVFFLRDYKLSDSSGEVSVLSTSSWVIMDISSRHAVRTTGLSHIIPLESASEDSAIDETAPKLRIPEDARKVSVHKVVYSDLDYNGHVNNARYAVWACDVIPFDLLRDGISGYDINFDREARLGEEIEILVSSRQDGFYVAGLCEGERVFVFRCI